MDDRGRMWFADNDQNIIWSPGIDQECHKININSPYSSDCFEIVTSDDKIIVLLPEARAGPTMDILPIIMVFTSSKMARGQILMKIITILLRTISRQFYQYRSDQRSKNSLYIFIW